MNRNPHTFKAAISLLQYRSLVIIVSFLLVVIVAGSLAITTKKPTTALATTTLIPITNLKLTSTKTPLLPHKQTYVRSIHMVNNMTGWISCADGSVLRTTNGGLNWVDVTPSALLSLKSSHSGIGSLFPDGSTAWIVVMAVDSETSFTFHTSDAGKTWLQGTLSTNESLVTTGPSYNITTISAKEGWTVSTRVIGGSGNGAVFGGILRHTTDGGQTWAQDKNYPIRLNFNAVPSISFVDQHTAIMIGSKGGMTSLLTEYVYLTQNNGTSWRSIPVLSPDPTLWKIASIRSSQFLTSKDGIFTATFSSVSNRKNTGFSVFSTHNGGQTWTSSPIINVGSAGWSDGAHFFDTHHGYILFEQSKSSQFYITSDGGQHWKSSSLNLPDQKLEDQAGEPTFISPTTGWLLAASLPKAQLHPTSLYTTGNSGKAWTQIHAHFPSFIIPKSAY